METEEEIKKRIEKREQLIILDLILGIFFMPLWVMCVVFYLLNKKDKEKLEELKNGN